MPDNITVIGDGGWGTALALVLDRDGRAVTVWGPFPDYLDTICRTRENPWYLPGIHIPESIRYVADREAAVTGADVVVLAVPSQYFRTVAETFAGLLPASARLLSVAKGFDPNTHRRMTEVAAEVLGRPAAALSGPSHAEEVARGIPTAVVIAAAEEADARSLQAVFADDRFRVYTSRDVIGVELGGALKNVIAVAVGISDGLGFGDNTRAAVITRGLAEITRLGVACGADPRTFAGLSGMGDLIVTCTSRHSRNRAVGERIGRGEALEAILSDMKQVAEGVSNSRAVPAVARESGVETPVCREVYEILYEGKNPHDAVEALLAREAKPE